MISLLLFIFGLIAWFFSTIAAGGAATLLIPVIYGAFGALSVKIASFGVALGLGAIVGVFLARKQLSRVDTQRFKQYTLILMFISGIAMLYKAI